MPVPLRILNFSWPAGLRDDTREARLLRFFVRFNAFAIPLYVILFANLQSEALQRATADAVLWLLQASGFQAAANGLLISIPITGGSWAAFINWDCTGWKSALALFALIFASEARGRKKLFGIAFVAALFAVNLARIWFMFWYVSAYDLANYAVVHDIVWSWGLIFAVIALWIAWARMPEKMLIRR